MIECAPSSWSVVDLLDCVLDKGIVLDSSIRAAAPGVELLAVQVVVASITVYLTYHQFVPPITVNPEA